MGLLGAFGLSMAYLVVVSAIFRDSIRVFGPATLAVAAPVGFLAGASFALLPRLSCGAARLSGKAPPLIGALCAGLLLGLWMFIPNWFLGIGCAGSHCELYVWLLWLVPGLLTGPLLGVSLVWLRWRVEPLAARPELPAEKGGMLSSNAASFAVVTLIGGLGMFAVRSPAALTFGILEPLWAEALLWGVGGAILGAMLAVGWYITLPTGSQAVVTLRSLCPVLLGRPVAAVEQGGEQ